MKNLPRFLSQPLTDKKAYFIVLLCVLFSAFLKLYKLGSLPSELHRDEAAIGYNAYSVLTTGRDEHSSVYPIVFVSFGDFKLPVLIYSTALSIKLFGLTPFAVRIPTVFFSLAFIPLTYFFSYQLFFQKRVSLIVTAVVTFTLWQTYLSRTAYEPTVGLTFSTLSLYFFLKARKAPLFFIFSGLSWVLACLAYNIPMLLGPICLFVLMCIYKEEYFSKKKTLTSLIGVLFVLLAFIVSFGVTLSASQGKTGTTIFSSSYIAQQTHKDFAAFILQHIPYKISLLLNNTWLSSMRRIVEGYFASWNPNYLFVKGSESPWHSLHALSAGDIQWGAIPFFVIGIWQIVQRLQNKDEHTKPIWFLTLYLLLAPVISALTLDSPNTNRLLDFHFAVCIVIALGVERIVTLALTKKNTFILNTTYVCLFLLFFGTWLDGMIRYSLLHRFNLDQKWNEGIGQAATITAQLSDSAAIIYIDANSLPESNLLYTHFAFYGKLDPTILQHAQWSKRYAFLTPDTFGKYQFTLPVDLERGNSVTLSKYFPDQVETVLFVKRLTGNEVPSHFAVGEVDDAFGKPIWEIAKVSKKEL